MSCRTELSLHKAKLRIVLRLINIPTVWELVLLVNEELVWILMVMLLILNLDTDWMMLLFNFLLIHAILRILSDLWRRLVVLRFLLIIQLIKNFYSNISWVRTRRHCLRSFLIDRVFCLVSGEELLLRNSWVNIVWYRTHIIIWSHRIRSSN